MIVGKNILGLKKFFGLNFFWARGRDFVFLQRIFLSVILDQQLKVGGI